MEDFITDIRQGRIDVNGQENFISTVMKSFLFFMNKEIKLRDIYIPHLIINSGDDILYLENKGYDFKKEPLDNTNENYVINKIPRAIVNLEGINLLTDQLSSPYTRGNFEFVYDDITYSLSGEFRRIPMTISVNVKYYLDSYLDALDVTQYLIANCGFVRTFKAIYMGKTIVGSFKIPDSFNVEKNIEFDGGSTDSKYKTVEVSLEIETNIPTFNNRTVISNDKSVGKMQFDKPFKNM